MKKSGKDRKSWVQTQFPILKAEYARNRTLGNLVSSKIRDWQTLLLFWKCKQTFPITCLLQLLDNVFQGSTLLCYVKHIVVCEVNVAVPSHCKSLCHALLYFWFSSFFLWQGLRMQPRMTSNSHSSHLYLQNSGIIDMYNHTQSSIVFS
jgi:hypothetical protein